MEWKTINNEKDLPLNVDVLVQSKGDNEYYAVKFYNDSEYGIVAYLFETYIDWTDVKDTR